MLHKTNLFKKKIQCYNSIGILDSVESGIERYVIFHGFEVKCLTKTVMSNENKHEQNELNIPRLKF